jgi:hypothetical protein
VRLYETGVGYFEREGVVTAGSESLPVPASHVDDALKTLVVLSDRGAVTVTGVEFGSVLSRGLARSLAALPLDSEKPVSYRDVLESFRGVDIVLGAGSDDVEGKLVEVADAPPRAGAQPDKPKPSEDPDFYLSIVMQNGAVRRFRASEVTSVRPSDPALAARLGAAVSALSGRAAQIRRSLRILARGSALVRIGYVAETPVFRPTYRLVVSQHDRGARIQAWALIHNDTDEAWSRVKVELVHGRPESFLFPLSAPRYTRRELHAPADELSTVPQLADKTPDQIWGDHLDTVLAGSGTGSGYGHGRIGGVHRTKAPQIRMGATQITTGESHGIRIGDLAEVAQASGVEAGALFDYRLSGLVDLRAHGSALVPFAEANLEARSLTWFDAPSDQGRTAVRIVNTSAQTLPEGPVAVYENGGFSGETELVRLKPRERAFLRYGVDLDAELTQKTDDTTDEVQQVAFEDGRFVEHFVRHHRRSYEIVNRGAEGREICVVLDIVKNARLTGVDGTDFDPASERPLAIFRVEPRKREARDVAIDEALERGSAISNLSSEGLEKLAAAATLGDAERSVLRSAAALLRKVEVIDRDKSATDRDMEHITGDLDRIREHLTALGDKSGSPAGANPLVVRILNLEDKLSKARKRSEDLDAEHEKQLDAVTSELRKLARS